MTKISDLQISTDNRIRSVIDEINIKRAGNTTPSNSEPRYKYHFGTQFGTKFTSMNVRCEVQTYRHNYYECFELNANVQEKNPYLLISLSYKLKQKSVEITEDEQAEIVGEFLKYWVDYKNNRGIKRLFYTFTDNEENEILKKSLEKIGYVWLGCQDIITGSEYSWKDACIYRENITDPELENAIFVQKQIDQAMEKYPAFELQSRKKTGAATNISGMTYYYLNTTFRFVPKSDEVLVVFENGEETFEKSETLVEDVLTRIKQKMKLLNLLKPPVKNIKNFLAEAFKYNPSDEKLGDMVQQIDEIVGEDVTEAECVLLLGELRQIQQKYGKYGEEGKRIDKFQLSLEDRKYFTENFGNEFKLYMIPTESYYWYLLVQERSVSVIDVFFFPTKEEILPEEVKLKAAEIVLARRTPDLMDTFENIIEQLQALNQRCEKLGVSFSVGQALKYMKDGADAEFGKKWMEEKQSENRLNAERQ